MKIAPMFMRTQPQTDDEVSLNASNIWFGNNANDPRNHQRVNDDSKNANPEGNQPALLNEEQEYWQQSINEYEEDTSYGPQISSCKAGASKIFWKRPMKDDNLKLKLEEARIPSNCTFLQTKKTSPEIFQSFLSSSTHMIVRCKASKRAMFHQLH